MKRGIYRGKNFFEKKFLPRSPSSRNFHMAVGCSG